MKKVILSAIATLALGVAIVHAGDIGIGQPHAQDGTMVSDWSYAGVSITTVAISSANAMLFAGEGVVVGFVASSNTAITDFISFRSTEALLAGVTDGGNAATDDYTTTNEFARVYLASANPVGLTTGWSMGTVFKFPAPVRVVKGCAAKASVNTINIITYLWHKFGVPTNEQPSGGH